MELLIEPMTKLICLYKFLGYHRAELNWQLCSDPDMKLNKTIKKRKLVYRTEKRISRLLEELRIALSEDDLIQILIECDTQESQCRNSREEFIEIQHRPTDIIFNKGAFFNMTNIRIPEDIQIGLSFGHKFLFPYACTDKNMCDILAQLDLTITQAIPDLKQLGATNEICRILRKQSRIQYDNNKIWLSFVHLRSKQFFFQNKDIFATKSDKGGHTVVLSLEQYNTRLTEMLSDDSYQTTSSNPLVNLVERESRFIALFKKDPTLKSLFKGIPLYEPRTLLLSKFYGLIKLHKDGCPLRPITAMIGGAGYMLGKIFNKMLNQVFPVTKFHIRDSYNFVKFINKTVLKANDKLVSFDVVSMFTSIPTDLVKTIVLKKSNKFFTEFSLNRADLNAILDFLLVECTFFTAQDKIFKQVKGLPMGNCISPTLARIVMDEAIRMLLKELPQISFIKVFVDDTIAAIDSDLIDKALDILNGFMPGQIRFTKELENAQGAINFLNMTLIRHTITLTPFEKKYSVITKWYRKSFASGRLLNFFSSHKRTTILGTAIHFIKTVLILSDPCFYSDNRTIVIETLRENSFPESLILILMQTYYTYMKPLITNNNDSDILEDEQFLFYNNFTDLLQQNISSRPICNNNLAVHNINRTIPDEDQTKYAIFPHAIIGGREIKRILHDNKRSNVVLADSVRNTKLNSIRTIKTHTPLINRRNVILTSNCFCEAKMRICMTGVNETGTHVERRIITKKTVCDRYSHAFNKIKIKRGLFYANQTKSLLKFLHWKHRIKLDKTYKYEFPTSKLVKLI